MYLSVWEVRLVAHYDKWELLRVLRFSLDQKLLPPLVQRRETGPGRDIKHQHAAVGPSVQRRPQRLEPLSAGCVPDLPHTDVYCNINTYCL